MIKAYYIVIIIISNNHDNEAMQPWKVSNACATSQDQFVPLCTDPCVTFSRDSARSRHGKCDPPLTHTHTPHPHSERLCSGFTNQSDTVIRETAA